jgi:hypothetical protein
MAKRRKRKRWVDEELEDDPRSGRRSGRRRRHSASPPEASRSRTTRQRYFQAAQDEPARVAVAERDQRPKPPLTCYQCAHLVITRSLVKHVSQSWDHATVYPTLTCFQQRWTLEDPDSVHDHGAVSEYLIGGAENCPDFSRGYPRNHHDW